MNKESNSHMSELQKQVRKLEEASITNYTKQLKNDQEVLGFKVVEEANAQSGYKVKRVMSVNYETHTITIE